MSAVSPGAKAVWWPLARTGPMSPAAVLERVTALTDDERRRATDVYDLVHSA